MFYSRTDIGVEWDSQKDPREGGNLPGAREAQAQIDKDGIIVRDAKGNPVPHPALAIEKAAQVEVRAWSERFKPRRRQ